MAAYIPSRLGVASGLRHHWVLGLAAACGGKVVRGKTQETWSCLAASQSHECQMPLSKPPENGRVQAARHCQTTAVVLARPG